MHVQVIVKAWFRVLYRIYPYKLPVESLKIEHEAKLSALFLVTRPEASTDKSDRARRNHALIVL